MRSYYSHLESAMNMPPAQVLTKPTYRSSAIFPVIQEPGISSRILFMGYWVLKRNIQEIASVVTLRSQKGHILWRTQETIRDPRPQRIELHDYLKSCQWDMEIPFKGSLEIEFFSTVHLVFPFPATVINYYGPQFSSVVHTAQRVYNDFEDMQKNSQTSVPESGFNIYADEDREPFIGLINGCEIVPESEMTFTLLNCNKETMIKKHSLGRLEPYQTEFLYPAQLWDIKNFLKNEPGAVKIHFDVHWIFPRLIVGNLQKSLHSLSITHTYYDCSEANSESDYWRMSEDSWYPASLMVPVTIQNSHFTNVYFYPIYSPSCFNVDVEIYSQEGRLLGKKENLLYIENPKSKDFYTINLRSLCEQLGLMDVEEPVAARIIARNANNSRLPARIKIGLDLGASSHALPCNICTNLQPFNPALEAKPRSFRWGPILGDQTHASLWILNSSPSKNYQRNAEVDLIYYREQDTQTLTHKLLIPPQGFTLITPKNAPPLNEFLQNTIGWFTAISSNPYLTTFYFAENPSGLVGGDHGF